MILNNDLNLIIKLAKLINLMEDHKVNFNPNHVFNQPIIDLIKVFYYVYLVVEITNIIIDFFHNFVLVIKIHVIVYFNNLIY